MEKYVLKNIVRDISEIPEDWIYKYYYAKRFQDDPLKGIIHQPFDGRTIMVKSVQNRDSEPSLAFFYKDHHYYWKDFSSGNGGTAIAFVEHLLNKNRYSAENNIITAYDEFLRNGGMHSPNTTSLIFNQRIKIDAIAKSFGDYALKEWLRYGISLSTLNLYKVKELSTYTITKNEGRPSPHAGYSFGFYNNNGLYQIYNPNLSKHKYIYVDADYLIGSEQLEYKSDTCIIISGLKDIMALRDLQLDAEYVAGKSETCLLSLKQIEDLKSHYKHVLTMLDNDKAGINAMKRYKTIYGLDFVYVNLEKDLADNNIMYPADYLVREYTRLIDKKINKHYE